MDVKHRADVKAAGGRDHLSARDLVDVEPLQVDGRPLAGARLVDRPAVDLDAARPRATP